jgi:shikimate kinase
MKGPIVLVGLMGSGKTSVGAALARRLGWPQVDLDAELERRWGLSVAQQFAQRGEAEFRRREAVELRRCLKPGRVISTGGGVVLRPESRRRLKASLTVYLQASPLALARRLRGTQARKRPLLKGRSPLAVLRLLRAQRGKWYAAVAQLTVRAALGDADAVARRVLGRCKELC